MKFILTDCIIYLFTANTEMNYDLWCIPKFNKQIMIIIIIFRSPRKIQNTLSFCWKNRAKSCKIIKGSAIPGHLKSFLSLPNGRKAKPTLASSDKLPQFQKEGLRNNMSNQETLANSNICNKVHSFLPMGSAHWNSGTDAKTFELSTTLQFIDTRMLITQIETF